MSKYCKSQMALSFMCIGRAFVDFVWIVLHILPVDFIGTPVGIVSPSQLINENFWFPWPNLVLFILTLLFSNLVKLIVVLFSCL